MMLGTRSTVEVRIIGRRTKIEAEEMAVTEGEIKADEERVQTTDGILTEEVTVAGGMMTI